MSLEPDRWCLPGDWPRHKLRAYGRIVRTPGGAEYRRLLNFLSKTATLGERAILDDSPVPKFAKVPSIVNRRQRVSEAPRLAMQPRAPQVYEQTAPSAEAQQFSITIDDSVSVEALQHAHALRVVEGDASSNPPHTDAVPNYALPTADAVDAAQVRENESTYDQFAELISRGTTPTPSAETVATELDSNQVTAETDANNSVENQVAFEAMTSQEKTAELVLQNPGIIGEDGQFISHLELLLNEWFDRENSDQLEEADGEPQIDSMAKRRERAYALLKGRNASKSEPERVLNRLADSAEPPVTRREQQRKKNRDARLQEMSHTTFPLPNGMRREVFRDGSFIIKDAVGRVNEARAQDGATMTCSYDEKGHFKSFVRSDAKGKIYTTGVKDRHGVVVRDENGSVRAQGDSMTVDSNGCVSIRKFDGQFWSLDVMRGIHIERRILEDASGGWNSLTALLTSDGFRMVTRFQKLQESKREEFRKYGDWLASPEASKFRFYGRDGSMIQFDNDEDLEALRPSRIWPAGSRCVEREWMGRRQAGTAWEAVHRYIAQYLSAL